MPTAESGFIPEMSARWSGRLFLFQAAAKADDQIVRHECLSGSGGGGALQASESADACVIGVPDEAQVQAVKGFVVLKNPADASPETEKELINYCREHLIKWSCPRSMSSATTPKTLVGKVAFNVLEKEEIERLKKEGKYSGNC